MTNDNKNKRIVGKDKNGELLCLGDKVNVYCDYTENQLCGKGTIDSFSGGIICVNIEVPKHIHPFTKSLTIDMGQQGINIINYQYEKIKQYERN